MTGNKLPKLMLFFACVSFFLILGNGKALASAPTPASWYVLLDTSDTGYSNGSGTKIKYYHVADITSYSNQWSNANTAGTTADSLNNFIANQTQSGDFVYIASGDYKLNDYYILLNNKTLHLYGGFAGTETDLSDRDLSNADNKTIITARNGTGNNSCFYIQTDSTIDGFTMTGGNGGGIIINYSSPTITNCTITGNTADNNGGGIYISGGNPTITNCTITGNTADNNGGGIYISGGNPTITNCTITGNTADNNGGGIYISGGNPTITNCTITGNMATNIGGGIYISGGEPKITNCTITGNTAYNNGGGIFIYSSNPTITNCSITGNTATKMGGGIYISGGEPKITNCTITGNTANSGGGIDISGGNPTITNCTITGNTANSGGGIETSGSNTKTTITNCTIVNNKSNNNNSHEIYFGYGTTTNLINTLIWNSDSENAIVNTLSTLTYDHCAYPNADNSNGNINFTAWNNPKSSDVTVRGVKHIVYKIQDNYEALESIICKGKKIDGLTEDQIGNYYFSCPPSIGAVDINFRADINVTGQDSISSVYGTEETLTFTATVSLDNKALSTGEYAISWDTVVSPDTSSISIDQSGKLTVGAEAPAKSYDVTVKIQAVSNDNGTELKSNVAVKKIRVEIAKATIPDITKSKDLPAGKVSTDYSAELSTYFALTGLPKGVSTDWTIDGTLPDGLTCTDGVISGTPTTAGSFTFKVIGTATADNYNDASKDIEVSISVAKGDFTPGIVSKDLPAGKVATGYSAELAEYFALTETPEGASTSWTINGTLPDGLICNNGVISGTPTTSGTFNFSVIATAKLANYNTASKEITASITVSKGDFTPTVNKAKDLPAGKVGSTYSARLSECFNLTGTPEGTSTSWTINGTLPDGLICNNGVISGTPTTSGSFTFKVIGTATADNYNTASKEITASITVSKGDFNPTVNKAKDLPAGKVGSTYSAKLSECFTLTGTPEGTSTSWTINGTLPDGLTCTDGVISGTPTKAESFSFKVVGTATADQYNTASNEITASITVSDKDPDTKPDGEKTDEDGKDDSNKDNKDGDDKNKEDDNGNGDSKEADETVKEIEQILNVASDDKAQTLTQDQVNKVLKDVAALSGDLKLTPEETKTLAKIVLSADTSTMDSKQVEAVVESVARNIVSDDGKIDDAAMKTLTDSLATKDGTTGETKLKAEDLTKEDSPAAQVVMKALASSVENSGEKKELNLGSVALESCEGLSDLLKQVIEKSENTDSTSELTLNLSEIKTLDKVDNLENVSLKEIKLENNESVREVKLDGATVQSVDLKGSKVQELSLNANSDVKEIDASGAAELTSLDLASNDKIQTLDISKTSVSELNASGCSNLENLTAEGGSEEGSGKLESINLEGCNSIKNINIVNNRVLGVKKPSGFETPSDFEFKARGQKRTTDTKFSVNLVEYILNLLKSALSTADADNTTNNDLPFDIGDIVSIKVDGNEASIDNDGNLSATPAKSLSYELDPFGLSKNKSVEGGSINTADDGNNDNGMDVTIDSSSDNGDNANGSGGGCDLVRSEELGGSPAGRVRSVLILALFLLCLMEVALIKKSGSKKQ